MFVQLYPCPYLNIKKYKTSWWVFYHTSQEYAHQFGSSAQGSGFLNEKMSFELPPPFPKRAPIQKKPTVVAGSGVPPIRKMPSESGNVKRIEVSLCAKLSNGSLRFVHVVAGEG